MGEGEFEKLNSPQPLRVTLSEDWENHYQDIVSDLDGLEDDPEVIPDPVEISYWSNVGQLEGDAEGLFNEFNAQVNIDDEGKLSLQADFYLNGQLPNEIVINAPDGWNIELKNYDARGAGDDFTECVISQEPYTRDGFDKINFGKSLQQLAKILIDVAAKTKTYEGVVPTHLVLAEYEK